MESHAREQGCWGLRAVGTTTLVASILLAFTYGGSTACAQAVRVQAVAPPNPSAEPADPVQNQINDLNRRREEWVQKARERESQWRELAGDNNARREQILTELRQIREQMYGVEKDLVRLDDQRRQRLESQIARAQDRARSLIEQIEKLRVQTGEVQGQMEQLNAQNRRQADQIASALEQTRRQIRIMEDRLSGPGIPYQPRIEPPIPNPPLPPEDRRRPGMPVAPGPGMQPPMQRIQSVPGEAVRDLQEEVRQLRIEMQGTRQRVQELANRPQPPDPTIRNDLEQLRVKLDAIQQQVQQTQALVERRAHMDNPYSVGSAGGTWYPNYGW